MEKIIIDTNSLISFITDRDLDQQKKIAQIFEDAYNLKIEIIISEIVLTEFVFTLHSVYDVDQLDINRMMRDLSETPGIVFNITYDIKQLLSLWPEKITDYGDAVIFAVSLQNKYRIFTFDKALQRALRGTEVKLYNP